MGCFNAPVKGIKLKEPMVNGILGMAIVMEVATGEVKAIVNMHRGKDGNYYEMKNSAVSDLMEPDPQLLEPQLQHIPYSSVCVIGTVFLTRSPYCHINHHQYQSCLG